MSEQDQAGAELDDEVTRAARGLAQKLPIALSLLADQARRREDGATTAAATERAEDRQRAALTLQQAQTGYLHATAPNWSTDASREDLAATWVAAAPWRDRDPAAAHVANSIEDRLERDWPDLSAAYTRGRGEGLPSTEAMNRAVDERLGAGDPALRQAGPYEERLAEQHLSVHDHPSTPHVNERVEAVEDHVQNVKRALDLQCQTRPAAPVQATSPLPTRARTDRNR